MDAVDNMFNGGMEEIFDGINFDGDIDSMETDVTPNKITFKGQRIEPVLEQRGKEDLVVERKTDEEKVRKLRERGVKLVSERNYPVEGKVQLTGKQMEDVVDSIIYWGADGIAEEVFRFIENQKELTFFNSDEINESRASQNERFNGVNVPWISAIGLSGERLTKTSSIPLHELVHYARRVTPDGSYITWEEYKKTNKKFKEYKKYDRSKENSMPRLMAGRFVESMIQRLGGINGRIQEVNFLVDKENEMSGRVQGQSSENGGETYRGKTSSDYSGPDIRRRNISNGNFYRIPGSGDKRSRVDNHDAQFNADARLVEATSILQDSQLGRVQGKRFRPQVGRGFYGEARRILQTPGIGFQETKEIVELNLNNGDTKHSQKLVEVLYLLSNSPFKKQLLKDNIIVEELLAYGSHTFLTPSETRSLFELANSDYARKKAAKGGVINKHMIAHHTMSTSFIDQFVNNGFLSNISLGVVDVNSNMKSPLNFYGKRFALILKPSVINKDNRMKVSDFFTGRYYDWVIRNEVSEGGIDKKKYYEENDSGMHPTTQSPDKGFYGLLQSAAVPYASDLSQMSIANYLGTFPIGADNEMSMDDVAYVIQDTFYSEHPAYNLELKKFVGFLSGTMDENGRKIEGALPHMVDSKKDPRAGVLMAIQHIRKTGNTGIDEVYKKYSGNELTPAQKDVIISISEQFWGEYKGYSELKMREPVTRDDVAFVYISYDDKKKKNRGKEEIRKNDNAYLRKKKAALEKMGIKVIESHKPGDIFKAVIEMAKEDEDLGGALFQHGQEDDVQSAPETQKVERSIKVLAKEMAQTASKKLEKKVYGANVETVTSSSHPQRIKGYQFWKWVASPSILAKKAFPILWGLSIVQIERRW